jgi:F-type H+-transporting ATPase subunit a
MIGRTAIGFLLAGAAFAQEHAPEAEALAGEHGAAHEETLAEVIMHHIVNAPLEHPLLQQWGVSKAVLMMLIASALLILMFAWAMRRTRLHGAPNGLTNALETLVVFIRDEVAVPAMGHTWGARFTPFLCTVFFFVLMCNLLGLVPGSYTATSNLNVTATLALITLALIVILALFEQGPVKYLKHMAGPPGTPVFIVPLVFVIEVLSLLVKPIALTIRLGANMTAGHIVILVMISFIFVFQSLYISVLSVPLAVAISILELIVAFIQAYVFTLLSSIFIGMSVHSDH